MELMSSGFHMKSMIYKTILFLIQDKLSLPLWLYLSALFMMASVPHAESEQLRSEITFYSDTIFYEGKNRYVTEEIEHLTAKKINFKAQTSFIIPLKERANAIKEAEKALTDIELFNSIPYYSKRNDSTSPLFRDIKIIDDYTTDEGIRHILTEQTILPFNPAKMKFTVIRENNFLMFKAVNIEKVSYWIFPLIGENKLIALFSAEHTEKGLECYGLGVADTGSFLFLRKRIADAFNGRTEALINWIHSLLKYRLGSE